MNNMLEIIKYASPAAVIGAIWLIVKFYQSRFDTKSENRRSEKLIVYSAIQLIIKDIEYALVQFMSNTMISGQIGIDLVDSKSHELKEGFSTLEESITVLNKKTNLNLEDVNQLDKHFETVQKKLEKQISSVENIFKTNEDKLVPQFDLLIKKLEDQMEEINKISTVTISNHSALDKKILELTIEINAARLTYGTNAHLKSSFTSPAFVAHLRNLFDITNSISSYINSDLK